MALIEITFTDEDVLSYARESGVPEDVALARADSWAKAISETASDLISEQLESVVRSDQP